MSRPMIITLALAVSIFTAGAQQPKKNAAAYYKDGISMMEAGRYNDALPLFKKATDLNKKYHEAFMMGGVAYTRMFKAELAMPLLKQALKIKPDYGTAYAAMGDVYKDILKKTDSALIMYKKAIEFKENTKELNYNIAWCYNERGNYEAALAHLKEALILDNEYKPAYHEMAFTYRKLHQLEECIEQFKKNIAISKNEIALYYTGLCQMELGRKADAEATLDVLKSISSKYAVSLRKQLDKKEKALQQQAETPKQ